MGIQVFQEYRSIYRGIQHTSKSCKIYLIYLVILFGVQASLGTYNRIMSLIRFFKGPMEFMDVATNIGDLIDFISQTGLLLLFPLVSMSRVSTEQNKVITVLMSVDEEESGSVSPHGIAHNIDLLHRSKGIGYSVFGTPVTKWKAITWLLVGPLLKILISKLF